MSFLGNYSIYTMEGVDDLVIRSKGGPTKDQIENGRQFRRQRENMLEFAGCSKAAGFLNSAMFGLKTVSNANFLGKINKLSGIIMRMDMDHEEGQRSILFSRYGSLLAGFNVNTKNSFDNIVLQYTAHSFSRNDCKATVNFPAMVPGVTLKTQPGMPYVRFIGILGIVPDLVHTPDGYRPVNPEMKYHPLMKKTD